GSRKFGSSASCSPSALTAVVRRSMVPSRSTVCRTTSANGPRLDSSNTRSSVEIGSPPAVADGKILTIEGLQTRVAAASASQPVAHRSSAHSSVLSVALHVTFSPSPPHTSLGSAPRHVVSQPSVFRQLPAHVPVQTPWHIPPGQPSGAIEPSASVQRPEQSPMHSPKQLPAHPAGTSRSP